MAAKHPAARIAANFPTGPCILRFPVHASRENGLVERGSSTALVLAVWDRRPIEPRMVATIYYNGVVETLVRNFAGEDNPNTPVDPLTLRILDAATIEHIPSTAYVADTVRQVLNVEKGNIVDRTAEAVGLAGNAVAKVDALKMVLDSLPREAEIDGIRREVAAARVVADSSEARVRDIIATFNSSLEARAQAAEADAEALRSKVDALTRQVGQLDTLVTTLAEMLLRNSTPAEPVAAVEQASEMLVVEAPAVDEALAMYTAKIGGMNIGALKGACKDANIAQPAKGEPLDEVRKRLADAYRVRLAKRRAQAA